MTRESAISRATRHFDEGEFIEDLARRVAIRTESQIAESRALESGRDFVLQINIEFCSSDRRMTMYALVVPLKVKPEMREKFLAAALEDSTCSVRDEPGCLRFDVLQDNTDPNKFFFYEVYLDESAVEAHRASAHYARWRAVAPEVLAEPTNASRCTTMFPKDYK